MLTDNFTAKPITDLSKKNLSGWEFNRVVVGNSPDPRSCDFEFCSYVLHNWPSQWRSVFREGYIQFSNGKRFDRAAQTIGGTRKYLFFWKDVRVWWELSVERKQLVQNLNGLNDGDFVAAAKLIEEGSRPAERFKLNDRAAAQRATDQLVFALGIGDLKDFNALIATGERSSATTSVAA